MIIVENLTRTSQTISLLSLQHGVEATATEIVADPETGRSGIRQRTRTIGASLYLQPRGIAGCKSEPLPDTVANDPVIQALVARGLVRVVAG